MDIIFNKSKLCILNTGFDATNISDLSLWQTVLKDLYVSYDVNDLELEKYEIIIVLFNRNYCDKVNELKSKYPNKKLILIMSFGLYPDLAKLTLDEQVALFSVLKMADGLFVTDNDDYHFYKSINPKTQVIGIPFNFDYVKDIPEVVTDENKIGIGIGYSDIEERNLLTVLITLEKIKNQYWNDLKFEILSPTKITNVIMSSLQTQFTGLVYEDKNYTFDEYCKQIKSCRYIVQMNFLNSFGRIVGESVMLNKICIGSKFLTLQKILFPSQSTEPFSIDTLENLIMRLKNNKVNETTLIGYAKNKLHQYDFNSSETNFYSRLLEIL